MLKWGWIACVLCVYGCYIVYIIFIKGREVRQKDDTANLNNLNMYVRDVVVVFKLFCWGLPPSKKIFAPYPVAI